MFFHQTSMRFQSAMATLEREKNVIAKTVWTKNILLVSGRLVRKCQEKRIQKWKMETHTNFIFRTFTKINRIQRRIIFSFAFKKNVPETIVKKCPQIDAKKCENYINFHTPTNFKYSEPIDMQFSTTSKG